MTRTVTLTDDEQYTLSNHLRAAADQYAADAANDPRLAEMWTDLGNKARRLADRIEAAEVIMLREGE